MSTELVRQAADRLTAAMSALTPPEDQGWEPLAAALHSALDPVVDLLLDGHAEPRTEPAAVAVATTLLQVSGQCTCRLSTTVP